MLYESFGDRLMHLLDIRGWNQRDLAKAVKVSEVTVSRWVNDERAPNIRYLIDICNVMGVSSDWLLGLTKVRDKEYGTNNYGTKY